MAAAHSGDIPRLVHFNSRVTQSLQQCPVITTAQGRVRLLRRTKVTLDSKMELHAATLKPASTTLGKLRRLGQFPHPEQAFVKAASLLFLARRHGKLHVIDGNERC